jgi:hypothetical protein
VLSRVTLRFPERSTLRLVPITRKW